MRKIDHIRKLVYIIVGILTIVSLVFTLYKKIGHCENITYYTDFPLPIGNDIGGEIYWTEDDYNAVLGLFSPYGIAADKIPYILIYEITDTNNYMLEVFYVMTEHPDVYPSVTVSSNGNDFTDKIINFYGGNIAVRVDSTNHTASFWGNGDLRTISLYVANCLTQDSTLKSGLIVHYPILSYPSNDIYDSSDNLIFSKDSIVPPVIGHTKGAVLSNYIDSQDLIEDSSEVEKVDTSDPSDSSSVVSWLKKILHGEGVINNSIQAGTLTLGDYLGQIKDKIDEVKGKIQEGIDYIKGIYDWFTESFDQEAFEDELMDISLISDLVGLKSIIEGSGMFDWSDVSPASTLSFTFDFGGAVLPHTQTVIDFSWYTGTIKNLCVAILCTFLVIGLFATIVNSIPNIISGHSGDKGGGSDS